MRKAATGILRGMGDDGLKVKDVVVSEDMLPGNGMNDGEEGGRLEIRVRLALEHAVT